MQPQYVLIVCQTKEDAKLLNETLAVKDDRHRVDAISVGQVILGWNHRGVRPNVIVKNYEIRNEYEAEWERMELLPNVRLTSSSQRKGGG